MYSDPVGCMVAVSFDFDGELGWIGSSAGVPGPGTRGRGRYGAFEGLPRVVALLAKFDVKATFFVPGWIAETYPAQCELIVAGGHEIGHHGYLHESPARLTADQERAALERGLSSLAQQGVSPVGYRSPGGEVSPATFSLLAEYGFSYDSSMVERDRPYWLEADDRVLNLVEVPFAWELTDSAHFRFAFDPVYMNGMSAPSKVKEIWWGDFSGIYREGGAFVLTLHPEIIGRHHRLQLLEETIEFINGHEKAEFLRMREIAEKFRSAGVP